ncbi:MAG: DUF86 domain-containing protein [Acidobacteriia bacterium]|nr:DUF86 domain-containing protein [Terriglobia bacterium]
MKDDRLYLIHILECVGRVEEYTREGKNVFLSDRKSQDAVLRNLHTMTESTQRLSEPLKARHPEVDWQGLAGFRNVLVHDYLGVDIERVWELMGHQLPGLRRSIEAILRELGDLP